MMDWESERKEISMKTFTGNTRKEELEKITVCYRRLLYLSIALIVLVAAALITALIKAMLPSVIFLASMLLLRVTLYRKARNEYDQTVAEAVLTCAAGSKLDEFELSRKGGTGITSEDVLAAELYPVRDDARQSIGFYQGISGTSRGIVVSLNDTTLAQYQHAGRKGAAVACGVWMHFALPKDTGQDLRILSKEFLPDDLRKEFFGSSLGLTRRDPGECALDETFFIYESKVSRGNDSDSGDDAAGDTCAVSVKDAGTRPDFRSLPPSFISSVNSLSRKYAKSLAISLRGDVMDLFVKERVLAPNYRLNGKPDEKILRFDPIPEFKDALNLAKKL